MLERGKQRRDRDARRQVELQRVPFGSIDPDQRTRQLRAILVQARDLKRDERGRLIDELNALPHARRPLGRQRIGLNERGGQRGKRTHGAQMLAERGFHHRIVLVPQDQLLFRSEVAVHGARGNLGLRGHVLDGHLVEPCVPKATDGDRLNGAHGSAAVAVAKRHRGILGLTNRAVNMIVTIMSQLAATPSAPPRPGRIRGLDLARAFAVLGMIVVNYELSMDASGSGPAWLQSLTTAIQGRAAGTFVVLAGIGASLGSARARRSGSATERQAARRTLLRRSLFLLLLGTAFLTVWPADILHFYGVYLAVGAALLFAPSAAIVAAAIACSLAGLAFLMSEGWLARWDFNSLTYRGLWTPVGFARSLFLDGFHPVFPWAALYLFGLLLGRAPLASRAWRARAAVGAALTLALIQAGAARLAPLGIETPGWGALLATTSLPPAPGYLLAAGSTAALVLFAACELAERLPQRWLQPLYATGQLALTLYVGHVLVGLGALESLGRLHNQTLPFAVGASLLFFAAALCFARLWTRRYPRGPLEAIMRRVAG